MDDPLGQNTLGTLEVAVADAYEWRERKSSCSHIYHGTQRLRRGGALEYVRASHRWGEGRTGSANQVGWSQRNHSIGAC